MLGSISCQKFSNKKKAKAEQLFQWIFYIEKTVGFCHVGRHFVLRVANNLLKPYYIISMHLLQDEFIDDYYISIPLEDFPIVHWEKTSQVFLQLKGN